MFVVSDAAADRKLLTVAEAKTALSITVSTYDDELADLILQVSDFISDTCRIPHDGITQATMLEEEITETLRLDSVDVFGSVMELPLARHPVSEIDTITIDGVAVDEANYELDVKAGIVRYLDDDDNCALWPLGKIVIVYTAGWATVPTPVKLVAKQLVRESWSSKSRDPALRAETHEGLGSFQYFQASISTIGGLPKATLDALAPYTYAQR